MGGNAFRNLGIQSKRISLKEYSDIQRIVYSHIGNHFNKFYTIKSYYNKCDFGDIDFLVAENINPSWKKDIKNSLKASYLYNNNNNTSFLVNGFQLDFTKVNLKDWISSIFYYDYDPFGNLFGRIARFINCSFGHKGLYYKYITDNYSNYFFLTKEPIIICDFFKISVEEYFNGFFNLSDIYDYVISSEYFSFKYFLWENLDHSTRTRNKKRESYSNFLEYIKKNKITKKCKLIEEMKDNTEAQIEFLEEIFPNIKLKKEIEKLVFECTKNKELKRKWKSIDVQNITGCTGSELGKIIKDFKSSTLDWNLFLENNSEQQIKDNFISWWKLEYGQH